MLFKLHGIMPDVVARQNPILLLNTIALSADSEQSREIPDSLKFFYGD